MPATSVKRAHTWRVTWAATNDTRMIISGVISFVAEDRSYVNQWAARRVATIAARHEAMPKPRAQSKNETASP